MSIIGDGDIYVCDFCGDDNGHFNSETGNHPACEELDKLRKMLIERNVTIEKMTAKIERAKELGTKAILVRAGERTLSYVYMILDCLEAREPTA